MSLQVSLNEWLQKRKEEFWDEWHSFWIGFAEGICFFIRTKITIPEDNPTKREYWYYAAGRWVGFLTWIPLAKLIQIWFW